MHRTARRSVIATNTAPARDDLMALADATSEPKPTAEEVMALVAATPDPRATTRVVAETLRALDGGPLTPDVVRYLPTDTLLDRVGLDLQEIDRAELPATVRTTYTGMLLQPIDGRPYLLLPRGQDATERDHVVRTLVWRQYNDPANSGQPIHLPGSKAECTVPGCANSHLPDPDFDSPNVNHFGTAHHADDADGRHVIGSWFEINAGQTPHIEVETFPTRVELGSRDARAFAEQLRRLAAAIERDADTVEAAGK
ncbi:hypothetical protein [Kitasatospora sp. MBT66]|uniref:hypothetical protein n=1 Tax=Kitasatospora sp. MBT66 TaxID=1444769 RepID=UPI0005B8B987|nr:hypothetical protein [Kitasatospora sp. MBT66]